MVDGTTTQENDMITKAHLAAERLEKANQLNSELVKRQEALEARRILGGQSNMGQQEPPKISEEEKIDIENRHIFKGTAIERYL